MNPEVNFGLNYHAGCLDQSKSQRDPGVLVDYAIQYYHYQHRLQRHQRFTYSDIELQMLILPNITVFVFWLCSLYGC